MAETKPRGTLLLNPELMVAILKQYAASSTHGELEGILADFLRDDFGKQQVVGASRFMLHDLMPPTPHPPLPTPTHARTPTTTTTTTTHARTHTTRPKYPSLTLPFVLAHTLHSWNTSCYKLPGRQRAEERFSRCVRMFRRSCATSMPSRSPSCSTSHCSLTLLIGIA